MQTIIDSIGTEAFFNLAAAITGVIVLGWKIMLQIQAVKNATEKGNLQIALDCVEAGVEETYEEYVRALKDSAADGKLTDDERATARSTAIAKAVAYAETKGLDLVKTYGSALLRVFLERIIRSNKAEASAGSFVIDSATAPAETAAAN